MTTLPLIPATVIDRWSVPGWYIRLAEDASANPALYGPEDLDEALRDATRLMIEEQHRDGLDLITDGQAQRTGRNPTYHDALRGITPLPPLRRWGPLAVPQLTHLCVEHISAPSGLGLAQEYLPPPMGLAIGVVDAATVWVEPPDLVAERLRQLFRVVEPERLHAVPDNGLHRLPRAIAFAKAASLVAGARIVRHELETK